MARSGLVTLAQAMRIYFEGNGIPATVDVGLKRRFQVWNTGPGGASRVILIPGDYDGSPDGKALDEGTLGNPLKLASDNPRELLEWKRTVTVSVWGVDASNLGDEALQIEATDRLLELAVRAIHNAVDPWPGPNGESTYPYGQRLGADVDEEGSSTWGKVTRTYPPLEDGFGIEYLARFEMRGPLYDKPIQVVTPTLSLAGNFTNPAPPG